MSEISSFFPFDSVQADRRSYDVVDEMAGGVLATLRMARSLAASERAIDLAGLDKLVGVLCARALNLPEASGRKMRLTLCTVHEELEALSRAIAGDTEAPATPS